MLGRVLVVQGELQDSDTGGKDYFPSRAECALNGPGRMCLNCPGPELSLLNR